MKHTTDVALGSITDERILLGYEMGLREAADAVAGLVALLPPGPSDIRNRLCDVALALRVKARDMARTAK